MRTITFYSYKGGVGRSLALANIASRLLEFNRSVCVMDFDLEAPGVHMKFKRLQFNTPSQKGLVDYIYDFVKNGVLNESILPFSMKVPSINSKIFTVIPAGNTDDSEYWRKLSGINWYELIYENENGLAFFLDLKEKIKKEINPDFLLIDSRTGISEMSGITLSLLAEEVVFVAANNEENLRGIKKIMQGMSDPVRSLLGKPPVMHFVLSRIPFSDKNSDGPREKSLVDGIKRKYLLQNFEDVHVIHSDRDLEWSEQLKINNEVEDASGQISKDYLKLFGALTKAVLTDAEISQFERLRLAERYFVRANDSNVDVDESISLLTKALEINPTNAEYFFKRAQFFLKKGQTDLAFDDCNTILSLNKEIPNPKLYILMGHIFLHDDKLESALEMYFKAIQNGALNNPIPYTGLGAIYSRIKDYYDEGIRVYEKAIELEPAASSYNGIGNIYRLKGDFKKAFEYIYTAVRIDPDLEIAFATLAEINAALNNVEDFYLNIERSLRMAMINNRIKDMETAIGRENIYKQFEKEKRFQQLLEKYNIIYEYKPTENLILPEIQISNNV
jgi:tetratricopeptide (TPR) repeat protein